MGDDCDVSQSGDICHRVYRAEAARARIIRSGGRY
jgi:hypothetical protein